MAAGLDFLSFNPCFCGTRPRRSWRVSCQPMESWFQSLFLWNSPSEVGGHGAKTRKPWVSILVFVELALGAIEPVHCTLLSTCFNPCFCGTRPRSLWSRDDPKLTRVSILVFVQLALGVEIIAVGWLHGKSFNPCFCGTRPRSSVDLPHIKHS